jgi:heat shock protein HslJ
MHSLPALAAAVFLAAALPTAQLSASTPYAKLPGSAWEMIAWEGQAAMPERPIRLRFGQNNAISGRGACNHFMGTYEVRGDGIALQASQWTKMWCGGHLTALDSTFAADLLRVARLELGADGVLVATDARGTPIFRFRALVTTQ